MFTLAVCLWIAGVCNGQNILGKHPRDKFTTNGAFFEQNSNTFFLIQGVNDNHGTNRWEPSLIAGGTPEDGQVPVYRDGVLGFEAQSGSGSSTNIPAAQVSTNSALAASILSITTNVSDGLVFVDAAKGDDATGQRENPTLRFATIQAATTNAQQGDTVYVFPGTYQEQIVCATNVGYYFASGVVLTNVAGEDLFTVDYPLMIRGSGVLQCGTNQSAFSSTTSLIDVECLSITVATNAYAFNVQAGDDLTLKVKAETFSGGWFTIPDLGAITNSEIEIKTFSGGFEEGSCVLQFSNSDLDITSNLANSGEFTFIGGSVTGFLNGTTTFRNTVTDDATVSGETVSGTYFIP